MFNYNKHMYLIVGLGNPTKKYEHSRHNAVNALMNHYRIDKDHLIVIYDDTDIDAGKLRIRKGGSAGGHNGMKDIINMIGTNEFVRIRIGIGKRPDDMDMVDFVLGRPEAGIKEQMDGALIKGAEAVQDIVINGADHAMNIYNIK